MALTVGALRAALTDMPDDAAVVVSAAGIYFDGPESDGSDRFTSHAKTAVPRTRRNNTRYLFITD